LHKTIITLFILGLSFGTGPCVAACGPILISYIAGTNKNIGRALKVYILFSLSRVFVYCLLGVAIFFLGKFALEQVFTEYSKYIFLAGGAFIILVGVLTVLGKRLELHKPLRFLQENILKRDSKSIIVFGLIIGILPCAPLLAALSYVGLVSKSWGEGLLYSFSFGLGTLISPLIFLVILAGLIPKIMRERNIFQRVFNSICGLIIILLGLQLFLRAF